MSRKGHPFEPTAPTQSISYHVLICTYTVLVRSNGYPVVENATGIVGHCSNDARRAMRAVTLSPPECRSYTAI